MAWKVVTTQAPPGRMAGAHPRPGTTAVYSCRGIHVTIKQPPQKDDRTQRVVIADESRNALKMAVLRHRHTPKGAWGCVIVLYFPFRQTTPTSTTAKANTRRRSPCFSGLWRFFKTPWVRNRFEAIDVLEDVPWISPQMKGNSRRGPHNSSLTPRRSQVPSLARHP